LFGNSFVVDFRARCAAASPPARRSQELSGGGCKPVPEPMPLSPRLIAGLSSSASAGPIGWTSGRWALDFGVLGFLGVSGLFAMPQIWGESVRDERAGALNSLSPLSRGEGRGEGHFPRMLSFCWTQC